MNRAYANENPHITQNNNKTSVIDLGGGTSDFETTNILFPENDIDIVNEFKELNKGFNLPPFNDYTWNEWNKYFESNIKELSSYYWKYPNGESIYELKNRVLPKFFGNYKG